MPLEDLQTYANCNWTQHLDSITNISKINNSGRSLVYSEQKIFSFDNISKEISPDPTSADGLFFTKNEIILVEFKSGFKQKITKSTLDPIKSICPDGKKFCTDYWDLFFKKQKLERQELLTSIRCKSIESYITLDKHIFPIALSAAKRTSLKINFIVVIDEDEVDNMEDTLSELANRPASKDNCFDAVKQSLNRMYKKTDCQGSPYYYDQIKVMSVKEFLFYLQYIFE